ncbi:MAG: AAA family ATPase [Saprospiraceae bacterium]|nr:AAA family ATPase [Saprospiraceae bacterium]
MGLLQLEKQEDYEQFRKMVESLSMQERKEEGYTWMPVKVIKSGYTIGEKAFVIVERTTQLNKRHQFRSGMPVRFYTLYANAEKPECNGVINYVERNKMKIVLNVKDLPEWIHQDQIGVDMLFDGRTYVEMESALKATINAKDNRLSELREILYGKMPALFDDFKQAPIIDGLNGSQQQAVQNIFSARDVAIVHGPPGTGKTTTLVKAIHLICQHENQVLVTAPSNTAADVLTERLSDAGLSVLRIGHISRVDESIVSHTLEAQIAQHPDSKHIKKVKIEAAEARRQAHKFKRKFDADARQERNHWYQQARELSAWVNQLEDRLVELVIDSAQVIVCTLVGVTNRVLKHREFKTVFIDEAAQALEPAVWIAIGKAKRVIMAGDPFQLPPTVKSYKAARGGLGKTLIEKCLENQERVSLLTIQYRMHQAIMGFSNAYFYGGALTAHEGVQFHSLYEEQLSPVIFIDTAGCGFDEKVNAEAQSRYNPEEFMIVCEHLYQLKENILPEMSPEIALISPYREQVIHMQTIISDDKKLDDLPLQINTIDGFQGQERDVIYISLVRSNTKAEIGFLSDYRRMNVAMTRAKKLLVVVGDSGTIGVDPFYSAFLEYVEKEGLYETAWSYMR